MGSVSPSLLYIFGAGHSGSTLLDVLLSSHRYVVGTGEVHRLTLEPHGRQCGCGKPLMTCNWWKEAIDAYLDAQGIDPTKTQKWWEEAPVSLPRTHGGGRLNHRVLDVSAALGSWTVFSTMSGLSSYGNSYRKTIENSWLLFKVMAEVKSAKVLVDSTKSPLRGKSLYMRRPSDFLAIHLVRDGRAVCASSIRRQGVGMEAAAKEWRRQNRDAEIVLKSIPRSQVFRVRYEDVCDSPRKVINQILRAVNVPEWDRDIVLDRNRQHQIPGNPMLLSSVSEITRDDRWRQDLSPADLEKFENVAGGMNSRYGYR